MPIEMDGERYYTLAEAVKYLGISKETFYKRVKESLTVYHQGVLKREYFREAELDNFRGFHPAKNENERSV